MNILYGVNKEVNAEEVSEVFKKSGMFYFCCLHLQQCPIILKSVLKVQTEHTLFLEKDNHMFL